MEDFFLFSSLLDFLTVNPLQSLQIIGEFWVGLFALFYESYFSKIIINIK